MKYVDPVITERYARAFFQAASKLAQLDRVMADVEALKPMFGPQSKLQLFLDSPQVPTEAKQSLLDRALRPHVSPVTYNLLSLVVLKGRTDYVAAIFQRFGKLVRRAQGISEAKLVSAVPLGEGERSRLRAALETHLRLRLEIAFAVDPRVIGGVRFYCGDLLMDDTVRGKLDRLRERLEGVAQR